jgi:hypothetical protein
MRGYRGKKQFTAINHSNRAQKTGLSGYKAFYRNQSFKKKPKIRGYRGKKQFTEIIHSKKNHNAGL